MNNANLYFDAAASTPLREEVQEEMKKYFDVFGNNNSKHVKGFEAQKIIDRSLHTIADVLNVSSSQLALTYSGTDSNRRFLWSCARKFGWENIYASAVEHSSIADEILKENIFDPRGSDWKELKKKNPKVLCLMAANSETGEIFNVEKLRKTFPDALILSDWSQYWGKTDEITIPEYVDAVTFAPQKIYGPKGIGLLYLKNPESFLEISKDSHTKNCWMIAGMAKAFELLSQERESYTEKLKQWTDTIEHYIQENIPEYKIHSVDFERVPGTISVAFIGLRGAQLMAELSEKEQICVSIGSACTSDIFVPTKTMQWIEKDVTCQFPIRISLHKFLTNESVEEFCEILEHYVGELRK